MGGYGERRCRIERLNRPRHVRICLPCQVDLDRPEPLPPPARPEISSEGCNQCRLATEGRGVSGMDLLDLGRDCVRRLCRMNSAGFSVLGRRRGEPAGDMRGLCISPECEDSEQGGYRPSAPLPSHRPSR